MTQNIICSKERELGVMVTKIDNIDKKVTELHSDFKEFINKVDKVYATKAELKSLEIKIAENVIDDKNFKSKAWQIFIILLPYIFICIIAGLFFIMSNGGF